MKKFLRLLALWPACVFLFSCGFLQDWESSPGGASGTTSGGANTTRLSSTRGGRANTCFDNEDCSQLCATMLKDLEDLEKCHRLSQTRVQALNDTYNLLKTGEARKLEKITKEEMENFLKFGPELWRDAIDGFIVGLKDTEECSPPEKRPVPRRCRRSNYYEQRGYTKEGAGDALSWIASSDWLAALLQKHDRKSKENYMVLAALTQVLATHEKSNRFDYRGKITCDTFTPGCGTKPTFASTEDLEKVFACKCLHKGKYSYCRLAYEEEAEESEDLGADFWKDQGWTGTNPCL